MRILGSGILVAAATAAVLLGCGGGDVEAPAKSTALDAVGAEPPGDVLAEQAADLRPLKPGHVWHFEGLHHPEEGGPATQYQATTQLQRQPDGRLVEWHDNVLGESTEPVQILVNDDGDVIRQALQEAVDAAEPMLELRSPVRKNDRYPLASISGIPVDDVDGDGLPDTAALTLHSTVAGTESVSVDMVGFTVRAVRVDTTALLRVTLSSDGTSLPAINSVRSTWYAAGVGVVRRQNTARSANGVGPVLFEERLTKRTGAGSASTLHPATQGEAGGSQDRKPRAASTVDSREVHGRQHSGALIDSTLRRLSAPGLLAVARSIGRSPSQSLTGTGAEADSRLGHLTTGSAVNEPWEEYTRHVKRAEQISPHGIEVAGDSIQLQSGALSLRSVDISLPGNGALPVAVVRTFSTKSRSLTLRSGVPQNPNPLDAALGDWELDLPWVGGTFARTTGWINPFDGMAARRCSVTSPSQASSPSVTVGGITSFAGDQIWSGTRLNIPGRGARTMLVRGASTPQPTAGGTWVTSDWTSVSCLDTIPGASGEGFVATDANGVTYTLDWLAVSAEPALAKPYEVNNWGSTYHLLERGQYRLYASRVQDRHGNWVKYSYDNAHDQPVRLKRIESSDGRVITFTHVNNHVETATANGKTWRYAYSPTDGALTGVTLPDGSAWTINLPNFQNLTIRYYQGEPGEAWRNCGNPGDIVEKSYTGSVTHPGGAKVSFTLEPRRFVRREVTTPGNCLVGHPNDPNDDSEYHPTVWDSYAVVTKTITGPGLPTATWSYAYNQGDTTEVRGPGEFARYTFGNRFRKDEGKLLNIERGHDDATILHTQASTFELAQSGMPYATPIGGSGHDRAGHFDEEYPRPQTSNTIVREGVNFQWTASDFDRFARPRNVKRSSTAQDNPSRTETTTYYDNLNLWVLGQIDNVVSGNLTMVDHAFDDKGMPREKSEFGVLQWTRVRYPDGLLKTQTDGRGYTTTFSNYKRGIPQTVVYPTNASETAVVDNWGRITSHKSLSGHTTAYGYDDMGRLASITPPAGFTSTSLVFEPVAQAEFGLPAAHWRQTVTKGAARTVTYFDALWRPVMTRSFDNDRETTTRKVVVKAFDPYNRVIYQSQPQRSIALYTDRPAGVSTLYDALGRVNSVTVDSELGPLTTETRYPSGLTVRTTNPRSYITTQTLWALDDPEQSHISAISAPEGVVVAIARDPFGKPISITRNGLTRAYVYDAGQRLCKTIEPEVRATVQDYDAAGNIAWRAPGQDLPSLTSCDRTAVPESAKIGHTHDALNRPLVTTYGDASPSISRTWWPDGKLKTIASGSARWTYGYNALRQPTTESMLLYGTTYNFIWGYTPGGALDSLTYPDNSVVSFLPNALGEPTQAGSYASSVLLHPNGALSAYTLGNSRKFAQTLNERGLPELVQHPGVAVDLYGYDDNGNVGSITDQLAGTFSRSMTYDGLDRLRTANAPQAWGEASYTYDELDNIETATVGSRASTLHYDTRNRLDSVTTNGVVTGYQYDDWGNIRNKGTHSYTFDLGNRLKASSPGGSYNYDGHGRRVRMLGTDGSTRRQFYSQAGQLLWSQQTGGAGPAKTAYVYLGQKLIAEVNDGVPTYVHTDALGSPLARTNATGTVLIRTKHEPYGAVTSGTKPSPATGTIGFTGHVQDDKTELVYMQQRYYDPIAGRFLSVDPVTADTRTGKNFGRYHYAANNPYLYFDPDGRDVEIVIQRDTYTNKSVTGTITVTSTVKTDSKFSGFTLETTKAGDKGDKAPIGAGSYDAKVRTDHDPQRIELKDVSGYSNIQIHTGNDPSDVKGCFAVGLDRGTDKVTSSKDAMGKINDIVKADGGKITVRVEGAPTVPERKD